MNITIDIHIVTHGESATVYSGSDNSIISTEFKNICNTTSGGDKNSISSCGYSIGVNGSDIIVATVVAVVLLSTVKIIIITSAVVVVRTAAIILVIFVTVRLVLGLSQVPVTSDV